jgi:hypothetical protein
LSLLTLIQAACRRLVIPVPTSVVSSTEESAMQMLGLADEEGEELSRAYEWTALTRVHTLSTSNGTEEYALPSDFDRFIDRTQWDRTQGWRVAGPIDPVQWQAIKSGLIGSADVGRRFRILRSASSATRKIYIDPVPTDTATIAFEYISSNWCQSSGGTAQSAWAADTDTGIISERLMTLGLKWRWRRAKGFDYGMELAEYEQARDIDAARDRPAAPLNLGGRKRMSSPPWPSTPETGFGS